MKRFGVETALVTYHEKICEGMSKFFAPHNPEQWKKLISSAEQMPLPAEFYEFLRTYKEMLKMYKMDRICEMLLDYIYTVRPDLANVVIESKESGIERLWFYRNVELIYDRVMNPMKYMKPAEIPVLTSEVTCDKCNSVFTVTTATKDRLKCCPFCGQ